MKILKHLDGNNLHHAYLIEGVVDEILPELVDFFEGMGVKTTGNPDFYNISIDSFKIKDAEYLKSLSSEKSFSEKKDSKKIFVISVNNFLLEAQNALLKIFEEPEPGTHFFLIIPDKDILLSTVASRFYFIPTKKDNNKELKEAEKFIGLSLSERILFLKDLLNVEEDDEDAPAQDSPRSKANKFLNNLESVLSRRSDLSNLAIAIEQIWNAREFLRQPGSSAKSLMESVAIIIPTA